MGWVLVEVVGRAVVVRIVVRTLVVVGNGMVDRVETVVRIETVDRVEEVGVLELVDRLSEVGTRTLLAGPARYQFAGGSPRHSPTVTAL